MHPFLLFQSDDVMRAEKLAVAKTFSTFDDRYRARLADIHDGQRTAPPGAVPLGTVEFVQAFMARQEIPQPPPFCYPAAATDFLGRNIGRSRFSDVPSGHFIKPANSVKAFTGHIKGSPEMAEEMNGVPGLAQLDVWHADPVRFVSEARHYVIDDQVVGWSRYDENEETTPDPDPRIAVDVAIRLATGLRPKGYAIDVGLLDDGRTILVECNDGWALGYYRSDTASAESYAWLIGVRWLEIAAARPAMHCDPPLWSPRHLPGIEQEVLRARASDRWYGTICPAQGGGKTWFRTPWGNGTTTSITSARLAVEAHAATPLAAAEIFRMPADKPTPARSAAGSRVAPLLRPSARISPDPTPSACASPISFSP